MVITLYPFAPIICLNLAMATGGNEPILQHEAPPAYSGPPAGQAPDQQKYEPGKHLLVLL